MTNWVETHFENYPETARLPIVARSRFSLHLRRAGRSRLALITGAPMHYYSSASREWLPLDTRLQPLADGRLGAPGLPFSLGLDGSVTLQGTSGERAPSFPFSNASPPLRRTNYRTWRVGTIASLPNGRRGNPQDYFRELFRLPLAKLHGDRLVRETGSLRHEIILLPGGLREELTLMEAPKLNLTSGAMFVTESLLPSADLSPGILGEHPIAGFRLPQGWAHDAQGDQIPVILGVDDAGKRLYSGVPVEWLANAAYPVVIDPDIDFTSSTADGYIEGATVATSSTFDTSSTTINVGGFNAAGTPKVWRSYVKFNTSSLGPASTAEKVNLRMYPSAINNYVTWTIYVRQYDWSANDPMAIATREAAWDGLAAASNTGILATSADPAGTSVTSADLPTS